jgi:exopolysaccharide production protein ExoZ
MQTPTLAWLQALRGFAAVLVLLFHARLAMQLQPELQHLAAWFSKGFIGVDVFFVLSGFVVGLSAQGLGDWVGLRQFALKRLLRIYLAYWLILLAAVLTWVCFIGLKAKPFTHPLASVFLFDANLNHQWLTVAWSLVYELYFYALLAGFAVLSGFQAKRLTAFIAVFCALLLAWNHQAWRANEQAYFNGASALSFWLSPYCLEFFAGYGLLRLYQRGWHRLAWLPLGVALAAGGYWLGSGKALNADVPLFRVATYGWFGLGCVVAALGLQRLTRQPPNWSVGLGDASYSLYLWHTVLLAYGAELLGVWLNRGYPSGFTGHFALFLPLLCIGFSVLWYRALEKPIYLAAVKVLSKR